MTRYMPLALSLTLFVLVALSAARFHRQAVVPEQAVPHAALLALAGAYCLWLLRETRVAFTDITERDRTVADRGTREWYGLAHAATILAALNLPSATPCPACIAAGTLLALIGMALRVSAARALGRYYSHTVRLLGDHRVVATGPYRSLRHPAYTGMLVLHAGMALAFASPAAFLCLALLLAPAIVYRIHREEERLASLPGYREYAAGRKRLVPWIW